MNALKLSIAMIVKDEEKKIERCLKSIKKLDNKIDYEIVIVDTGSDDNTVSIAEKYTENIYCEKWNNNFADMRNISISHCSGDWILIIDADEVLENPDELVKILSLDDINDYNSIKVSQRNAQYMNSEDYNILSVFRLLKIIRISGFLERYMNSLILYSQIRSLILCYFMMDTIATILQIDVIEIKEIESF